jgi:hypothetical protein
MGYSHIEVRDLESAEVLEFPGMDSGLSHILRSVQRTFRCSIGFRKDIPPDLNGPVHLFYKGCPIDSGYIGLAPVQSSTEDFLYYVVAPAIQNGRYADHNWRYHMAATKNPDKAIQNANRYLRRPNMFDCANHFWTNRVRRNFISEVSEQETDVRNKARNISGSQETLYELEGLYRSGYTFQSATLADRVREWVKAKDAFALSNGDRSSEVIYTYVKPDGSIDACQFPAECWRVHPHEHNEVREVRELPEEVQRRIAALTICEDGSHVDLIGTRVAHDCFLVYA